MTIWEKEFLTKESVIEALKSREGRIELWCAIQRERLVHGLAHMFAHLGLPDPSQEQQEIICSIMWDYLYARPLFELLEDEKTARALMEKGIRPADMNTLHNMQVKGEA